MYIIVIRAMLISKISNGLLVMVDFDFKFLTLIPDGAASKYGDLNLNMTAAEMRERIGSKKKRDPRKDKTLDFRKKYEIIQTL